MLLEALARNTCDWETRGPMFAAMAAKVIKPVAPARAALSISTILQDANRYRKLVRLAKIVYVDGRPWVRFDPVDGLGAEIAEEDQEGFLRHDVFIARAVDAATPTLD
ncbi:hypothetical protein ACI2UK_13855 [Ralstonia nicotianae]|uniref:hypothetical protein n=1 Tax=Ralstonia pseudosolanacearum TaxID=1310165 RepID=UPI0020033540|nr:hypothetical protein [Ralstonia pseudosolanacearum]